MSRQFTQLSSDEKQAIWNTLNSGSYYLFVGSGVSLDSKNIQAKLKSASDLTSELRKITELGATSTLQQNYKLLTHEEIREHLTLPYTCDVAGQTIQQLIDVRWRRIYTLNIDNCLEVAIRQRAKALSLPENILSSYNFNELYTDLNPSEIHSIVHLHGSVEKPEAGYVFSYTEYAREMSRQNSWMATLTQLMKSEPFIISGTSLEEIDVEFYLQQHAGKSKGDDFAAHSVLIEPFPTRLTKKACDDHNLILFEGTTSEFFAALDEIFPRPQSAFEGYAPAQPLFPALSAQEQILFESSFEVVPKDASPAKQARRFLFGAPLSWDMLSANPDIARQAIGQIERDIETTLKSDLLGKIYLAEPGSGKSALLRRVAFRAAKRYKNVFYFAGFERISEEDAARIISSITGDAIIFFDNAADYISYFVGIWDALEKRNVAFVGIERVYRFPYIEDALSEFDVEIDRLNLILNRNEADRLIEKNEQFGFSDISQKNDFDRRKAISEILGEPISIANCRIQNNFPFIPLTHVA